MKKYRALQIILELAEGNMLDGDDPDIKNDKDLYNEVVTQSEAAHIVYDILKEEVAKDKNKPDKNTKPPKYDVVTDHK